MKMIINVPYVPLQNDDSGGSLLQDSGLLRALQGHPVSVLCMDTLLCTLHETQWV